LPRVGKDSVPQVAGSGKLDSAGGLSVKIIF
jgi:hypothetical protein